LFNPPDLPIVLCGGLLAAFTVPRGVEEGFMVGVAAADTLRGDSWDGARFGLDGEGVSEVESGDIGGD